jgi:hypothetical protein
MQLQQRPEPWMCMPLAFAMALEIPVGELLEELGHDGSELAFPNLPEPACRRGIHIQELVHVALRHGFALTPVELFPVLASADDKQTQTILYRDNNWKRFADILAASRGVIDGVGFRFRHMVAYDQGRIFDPRGHVYDYTRIACEARQFHTRCAWRLDPIGERTCE